MANAQDPSTSIEPSGARPGQERLGTLIVAGVLVAFGIFWSFAAMEVPRRSEVGTVSPGFVPFWAGIFLALFAAALFVSWWRTPPRPTVASDEPLFDLKGELRVLGCLAALFAYIALLEHVHFFLTTFGVSVLGLAFAGEPLRPRLLIIAAAIAGLIFAIFIWWLGVPLPGSRFA